MIKRGALLSCVLLWACDTAKPEPAADVTELEEVYRAKCERDARCSVGAFSSVDECLRESLIFCQRDWTESDSLAACALALRDAACGETPAACQPFLSDPYITVRIAEQGQPCDDYTIYCDANTYCEGGEPGSWCGVCTPKLGSGSPCAGYGSCRGFCDDDGLCQDRPVLGERCDQVTRPCGEGACVGEVCVPNEQPVGNPCSEPPECSSFTCVDGKCVERERAKPGQTCGEARRCESTAICVSGRCEQLGTCGTGGVGTPCEFLNDNRCAPGLVCEGATCEKGLSEGAACGEIERSCGPGLACSSGDGDQPRCTPVREDGDACKFSLECASGFCVGGVCGPPATCKS